MPWTPALVQTVTSVVVLAIIGLAVLGQARWLSSQGWRNVAEANKANVEMLEKELKALHEKVSADLRLQTVRTEALEAQISELQRLNLNLQSRLDRTVKTVNEVKEKNG